MAASRNNRHLTLTGPESTATLHSIASEGTFVEKSAFRVTSPIMTLFSKPTYKVCTRVGHPLNKLLLNTCLPNTDAGLNTIDSELVQDDWKHSLKNNPTTKLQSTIEQPITLFGTSPLFVPTGSLHVRVCFGIVKTLAVNILLCTLL